jgi:hypothetical protein
VAAGVAAAPVFEPTGHDLDLVRLPVEDGVVRDRDVAVAHAQAAPANGTVADRLVRPIGHRRIPPAQAIFQHKADLRDHPPLVRQQNPMRKQEKKLYPTHLRRAEQSHLRLRQHLHGATIG